MGGLPQAQYSVHPFANPSASGIKYDPLRYGLKPRKYRVKHFGHSTQWRTRKAIAFVDELLRELFPPALAVNNLGHVEIRVTQIVPHNLTSCALAYGRNASRGRSENTFIVDRAVCGSRRRLATFAAGKLISGCVSTTSATGLPWSSSTGVARKAWTIFPACDPVISPAIPAICPLSLMLLADITKRWELAGNRVLRSIVTPFFQMRPRDQLPPQYAPAGGEWETFEAHRQSARLDTE